MGTFLIQLRFVCICLFSIVWMNSKALASTICDDAIIKSGLEAAFNTKKYSKDYEMVESLIKEKAESLGFKVQTMTSRHQVISAARTKQSESVRARITIASSVVVTDSSNNPIELKFHVHISDADLIILDNVKYDGLGRVVGASCQATLRSFLPGGYEVINTESRKAIGRTKGWLTFPRHNEEITFESRPDTMAAN
jgi:hypothetical protein